MLKYIKMALWGLKHVGIVECANRVSKVKCTLVQALRLYTGRTAHTRNRCIALLFLDHGNRRGWGVSVTLRLLFTPGKDAVPIVQEAGWASRPVWTGAENLAPTGIRSPDRPGHSQSPYRLRYPAHYWQGMRPICAEFDFCCRLVSTERQSQGWVRISATTCRDVGKFL